MASQAILGPDRAWIPAQSYPSDYFNARHYRSDNGAVQTSRLQHSAIPPDFPSTIDLPTAWSGADLEYLLEHERHCLQLNQSQVAELEKASKAFQENGHPLEKMSRQNFPLPVLGECLKALARELTEGVGFFRVCGLDPKRYSKETNIIIYLGLTTYIGERRGRQDEHGNMLLHLTDVGHVPDPNNRRQAPYSNVEQPFHTDTGDTIALYSLGEAHSGGESRLASIATVYNEIAAVKPELINLLSSPTWAFDRFGQWPPYVMRPLIYPTPSKKAILSFSRRPLLGNASSPRSSDIPDLPANHVEALNAVQFSASRHALSMKLKPGDILVWNNLALMHGRSAFTDSAEDKRHLIRLWLHNEATETEFPIPKELKPQWDDAFEHVGRPQMWPLEPIRDNSYICTRQRSSGHA